jgi:hypothetical protein
MSFEKKKLMFICQKLDARFFFYLVGIEVFSKLLVMYVGISFVQIG